MSKKPSGQRVNRHTTDWEKTRILVSDKGFVLRIHKSTPTNQ